MINYGQDVVILGKAELLAALRNLPGRVVKKIMDEWTVKQARAMANVARRSAPRDRNKERNKPETARLWRSIRATQVKKLKKFPNTVSRAIAYGASSPTRRRITGGYSVPINNLRFKKRKNRRSPRLGPPAPRARHFHLAILGTLERTQRTTGRRTGRMWGKTANPQFWQKATAAVTSAAQGEVGAQLRDAYDRGIQAEIRRLSRKYKV